MSLRIFITNVNVADRYGPDSEMVWNSIVTAIKKVARPDTEIRWSNLDKVYGTTWYQLWASLEMLNSTTILRNVLQAEQEGYDAVAICCVNDPALHFARGLVDIPVTGAGEAAFMVAELLGRKFGVVTTEDNIIATQEGNMWFLGFWNRAIENRPIRAFNFRDGFMDAIKGNPDRLISEFEKVATDMVRDGADVIIAGCGYLGPIFTLAGYNEVTGCGVPVVDPSASAVKLAELLADFQKSLGVKKSTSSTSLYRTPPVEIKEALQKDFWGVHV